MKVEPGSLDRFSPARSKLTVSQEFQKAAMEQSKLLLASHNENSYNNRLVSMHTTKVVGVKVWIKDIKFLFLHLAYDDPARAGYMQQIKVLNKELEAVLWELTECEIAIVASMKKAQSQM